MIYVFHINTDDKENSLFSPSNISGKIYVNAMGWISNPQESKTICDQENTSCGFLTIMLVMM